MKLEKIGLLAVESSRTRAYLSILSRNELLPAQVIFLSGSNRATQDSFTPVPYFDDLTPALNRIRELELACQTLPTDDVNGAAVFEAVKACPVEVWIYSGSGGVILGRHLIQSGKRFLHVHPGLVPRFRGSTTIYYQLLVAAHCGASALFLDEKIDTGSVLATRVYPAPADRTLIDHGYDPFIRSDLLLRVLQDYRRTGEFHPAPQDAAPAETYYVMHPVLRHVAILSRRTGPHSQN